MNFKTLIICFVVVVGIPTFLTSADCLLAASTINQEVESGDREILNVFLGEKLFKKRCKACHSMTKNKLGPSLENLFGRTAGTFEKYKYSKAMKKSEVVWDEDTLKEFLKKPNKFIKGTRMMFPGIKSDQKLDDLIAYLKEN